MSQEAKLPEYKADFFVGRQEQIRQVTDAFRALRIGSEPEKRVFAFVGERGTGKTWLLSRLRTLAGKEPVKIFWLDLKEEKYTGKDPLIVVITILEDLARELELVPADESLGVAPSRISRKVMEALGEVYPEQPLLVLVDHVYETEWKLLASLEDYVLGPLAADKRTLLVFAGRGREYPWKTPELFAAASESLDPLTKDETREQIEKQVRQSVIPNEEVYSYTDGYPMQNYFLARYGFPEGLELSVKEILSQVDEHERTFLREYLEALSVLDAFDEDHIKWMLSAYDKKYKDLEQRRARAVREALVNRYGFARWMETRRAYVMDESVRLSVRNSLQHRDPERWKLLYNAVEEYVIYLRKEYKPEDDLLSVLVEQPIVHITEEVYLSSRATPELVGRKGEIEQIKQCIEARDQSYIVYVFGAGGTGKTRLLKHLIHVMPEEYPDALVAGNLVDLFDTDNRVDFGIAQAINEALDPDKKHFVRFRKERQEWLRSLAYGRPVKPNKMLQALLDEINDLALEKRLVLFLDTAERFFYPDPAAEKMELESIHLAGQDWIYEQFLAGIQNAVVVIAGRTSENDAKHRLVAALNEKQYKPISLQGFSIEEAQAYFDAVINASTEKHALTLVGWLQQIKPEERNNIFTVLDKKTPGVQGVLPLHLSLMIDFLALQGKLPDLKNMNIPDDLVEAVFTSDRPGADLLPYIGILPHGADEELLARMMRAAQMDEKWDAAYIRSYLDADAFKTLAFVKIRPEGRRLYLHDEFYRWAQQRAKERIPNYDGVLQAIDDYYDWRLQEQREAVESLSLGGPETLRELPEVETIRFKWRRLRVESMYYRLMAEKSTEVLFDLYFCAAEDALAAEDTPLENVLTAEMQAFVQESLVSFKGQKLNGISFEDVNAADAAVRWLKRAVTARETEEARRITSDEKIRQVVQKGDYLVDIEWKVWFGLLQTFTGEYQEAKSLLDSAQAHLTPSGSSRQKVIYAKYCNNVGYLARVEGHFRNAITLYRMALPWWNETNIETQKAYTLNNLAFAYAELGQLEAAKDLAQQAYQLRLVGGSIPIGLSLNTLAHIEIRDGNPELAQGFAEQALRQFQAADYSRGKGMAYVGLAESWRRQTERLLSQLQVEQYLRRAIQHAEEGVEIFVEKEHLPDRLVEAHIEAGCDWRDLAKYYREQDMMKESWEAAQKSEKHLNEAVRVAREHGILYRQVDALIDLAWLKYYILRYLGDKGELVSILDEAEKLILDDYKLDVGGNLNELPSEQIISPYFLLLGKSELLRGHIAFYQEFEEKGRNQDGLREAVHHYSRALCYDQHFSEHPFRDLSRAQQRITERCRQLDFEELRIFFEEAGQSVCGGKNPLRDLLEERGLAEVNDEARK